MSRILFTGLRLPRAKASLLRRCLSTLDGEITLSDAKAIVASVYGYSTWSELKSATGAGEGRSSDLAELDRARTLDILGRATGLGGPRLSQVFHAVGFDEPRSRLQRPVDRIRSGSVEPVSAHGLECLVRRGLDDLVHRSGWPDLTQAMSSLIVVCDRDAAVRRIVSDYVASQIAIGRKTTRMHDFLIEVGGFEPITTPSVSAHGLTLDYMRELKRFMRADPSLLRIEITDHEIARTALKAAGRGYLVLATMNASNVDECASILIGHGAEIDPVCHHASVIHGIQSGGGHGPSFDLVSLRLSGRTDPDEALVQSVLVEGGGTVCTTMGPPKASTAGSTPSISA